MGDAVELQLKLEFSARQLEEKDGLIFGLRKSLDATLAECQDLQTKTVTLKSAQDALLREKLTAEKHVEVLMREKAELASENARLHVFARDCSTKADAASRVSSELTAIARARASAEELVLAGGTMPAQQSLASVDVGVNSAALHQLQAQLAASRIMLSRLLVLASRHGLPLNKDQLLGPVLREVDPATAARTRPAPGVRGDSVAAAGKGGASGPVDAAIERELAMTLATQFGLHLPSAAPGGSNAQQPAARGEGDSPVVEVDGLLDGSDDGRVDAAAGTAPSPSPHMTSPRFGADGGGGHRPSPPRFDDVGASPGDSDGRGSEGKPAPTEESSAHSTSHHSNSSGSMFSPLFRPFRGLFTVLVGDTQEPDLRDEDADDDEEGGGAEGRGGAAGDGYQDRPPEPEHFSSAGNGAAAVPAGALGDHRGGLSESAGAGGTGLHHQLDPVATGTDGEPVLGGTYSDAAMTTPQRVKKHVSFAEDVGEH